MALGLTSRSVPGPMPGIAGHGLYGPGGAGGGAGAGAAPREGTERLCAVCFFPPPFFCKYIYLSG